GGAQPRRRVRRGSARRRPPPPRGHRRLPRELMPAVLRVAGLDVQYGGLVAARDISLEVHRGEIVSLLGPNGAGKTSVLRAVMGLVPRARGTVEFFDGATVHRVDTLATHRLAALGIASVPSLRIVLPRMTVEENLE